MSTVASNYSDQMQHVPLHFRERQITHLPGYTGENGYVDHPDEIGRAELHLPPHDRPIATRTMRRSSKSSNNAKRSGSRTTSASTRGVASGRLGEPPTLAAHKVPARDSAGLS